jgi:lysophospholipase L1-like esterase
MFDRRRLLTTLGLGAMLAACRSEPGSTPTDPAEASRRASGLAVGPDPAFEALLPARAGEDAFAPIGTALRALEGGADGRALVLILGDSHAAGPVLSERLRELLQGRYGALGPGRLPPARAQRFWNPAGLSIAQNGEWVARNALRGSTPGPFGLTGYRLTGDRAGDTLTLRTTDPRGFDRVHLTLHCGPGSGAFRLRAAGTADTPHETRTPAPDLRLMRLDVAPGTREVALELVGDGHLDLLGWGFDRRGRGVLVEAFGINGATLASLDNRDQAILARELQLAPPALVILEFGTNEATDRDLEPEAYATALTRRIGALRAVLPRTGILVMGVPDAGRPVRVTSRRPATGCAGVTPLVALDRVKAAQRRAVAATQVGFFDWSAEVTQDVCRLPGLADAAQPLLRRDLVHFTPEGYRLTAEKLHARIMRGAGLASPRGAGA